ncbi:hypothetical protein GCM10022221_28330 [Actinocorallia aurea]
MRRLPPPLKILVVLAALLIAGCAALFFAVGLDKSDKIASSLGLFLGILTFALALVTGWPSFQTLLLPDRQSGAGTDGVPAASNDRSEPIDANGSSPADPGEVAVAPEPARRHSRRARLAARASDMVGLSIALPLGALAFLSAVLAGRSTGVQMLIGLVEFVLVYAIYLIPALFAPEPGRGEREHG